MRLGVNFLGLDLKNPIIVASGPWSRNAKSIQKSIDAGAGAVVTETIMLEPQPTISPRFFYEEDKLFNTTLYSTMDLEQWEQELKTIDKKGAKLICSIWGSSPSEMAYLATKAQRMGADAIEMSISAPIGTKNERLNHHPECTNEFVRNVVGAVSIPVMVKLSYDAGTYLGFVKSIELAGANAISAIDSLKGIQSVNLETGRADMRTYGGYSGRNIRPVSLATTASLSQFSSCEICGIGGIETHEHALEYMMLGAKAVQLATSVMLGGYEVITKITTDLAQWMDAHGYQSLEEIRGVALASLTPFEDIEPEPYVSYVKKTCPDGACNLCTISCMYEAISKSEGKLTINKNNCTGCGLCVQRCSHDCLALGWK